MEKAHSNKILDFACGSMAGIIAETVTHPLDSAKTRLQMQMLSFRSQTQNPVNVPKGGHPILHQYRGVIRTIVGICKEEGIHSLFRGLPPALLRQMVKGGTQMSIYKTVRQFFSNDSNDQSTTLSQKVLAAGTAGAVGQLLGNPMDVVKVRLQMDGKRQLVGKTQRYSGTFNAFRVILTQNGILAFWRGVLPAMGRSAVSSGSGLASYDQTKQFLIHDFKLSDTSSTHLMCSAFSSFCSTIFGVPFDVIKTRMMEQSMQRPIYRNGIDCLSKTIRGESLLALYRGFIPTYFRVGPWQGVFFLSYESLSRHLIGQNL